MKMTLEQSAYVIGFLRAKNLLDRCNICKQTIQQDVNIELFEIKPGDPNEGLNLTIGKIRPVWYPIVYVCCPSCGNLMLFNATAMGLFPKVEMKPNPEPPKDNEDQEIPESKIIN